MSETIFEADLEVAMDISHNVAPPTELIELPVAHALGFVLANDIFAKSDLPPFAASRVDGYAINDAGPWKLVASNLAGTDISIELAAGQCCYVATGAPIPKNTFAILKQEDCLVNDSIISLKHGGLEITAGENVRPIGYEANQSDLIVKSSTKLTPPLLGLIAACGYSEIMVYQKPKIDVFILGDELISQGASGLGKVRDSIGPQIGSWISYLGGDLTEIKFVPDNLADLVTALNNSTANLIITTGGTASGPVDHLHKAIQECDGELLIDAVKVRPGYHQILAALPGKLLIGLPGNPQSAVIGLLTMVAPFISGSTNRVSKNLETKVLATNVKAGATEHKFVLARLLQGEQKVGLVSPVEHVDSSMLRGFVDADGYAIIPPGGGQENSTISWIPLPT